MKVCFQALTSLLCGAVVLCGQAALAGGPGCATCNGGGVGYAAAPMHMGVPADVSYGQLAPTDWNAPASRAGCCGRPQRDMCDWWAGYCDTQRVIPCQSGDCNYGKRGWGEGYFGASLGGGCKRACNNVGHGHGCGKSCCTPACNSCGSCNDCCAPSCGSGCGSSGLSGFFSGFSSLFGGGHCGNVVGGSSGPACCGGCSSQRCGHGCGSCGGCSAPCGKAPCRARQTWSGGCCNNGAVDSHYAGPMNDNTDSYYQETGASNNNNYSHDAAPSQDESPSLEPLSLPAPSNEPTPAKPEPADRVPSIETRPLDISVPAPKLNNSNRDIDGSKVAPPDSEADSI